MVEGEREREREIKGEKILEYLKKRGENRWKRIAKFRFRCGKRDIERRRIKKVCRLCEEGIESWEHLWEKCRTLKERGDGSWPEEFGKILEEEGEGESWIKKIE